VLGYAVIDIITSGPSPSADRIIELAIVHVDVEGNVTAEWETLVNPLRDLGSLRIRGIRPSDLALSPEFSKVAAELCGLLHGRIVVAHDALFTLAALTAELSRAGISHPELTGLSLCVGAMDSRTPGDQSSLGESASRRGIDMSTTYSARGYALVVAQILKSLMEYGIGDSAWGDARDRAEAAVWPGFTASGFSLTPRPRERSTVAG
jgi:DNA polymerase-3 subunit epsilon